MKKHYVYKLIDPITNEFYFGSRSCSCEINNDEYMGSYTAWKPEDETRLKKSIIKEFKSREKAYKFETNIIKENIDNTLNRNYHIPTEGFHTNGRIVPEEQKERQRMKMIGKMSGKKHPLYGTIRHDMIGENNPAKRKESRKKISKMKSGKNNTMYGKTGKLSSTGKLTLQFNKDGVFIKEWESARQASISLGIKNITSCCTGKLKTSGGFIWRYKRKGNEA